MVVREPNFTLYCGCLVKYSISECKHRYTLNSLSQGAAKSKQSSGVYVLCLYNLVGCIVFQYAEYRVYMGHSCQITAKKTTPSWIWMKLGSYIVSLETFTLICCIASVLAHGEKLIFSPNIGWPIGTYYTPRCEYRIHVTNII